MRLRHFAEPRPPYGGIGGAGALNLLGRPDLDPLVVLAREAAQNSWDARSNPNGPVDFALDLRGLSRDELSVLREQLFFELPPQGLCLDEPLIELADALRMENLRVLTMTDTGTTGLGGPVRADTPSASGEPTDFVDLVFNIGAPPDRSHGGGTYGFGKTISYLVSACRTVVLHTVTRHDGELQHRLIGLAIGGEHSHADQNFTGRHWWGVTDGESVEPLVGQPAARLANNLGLPDLESAGGGTTLMILHPDLGRRSAREAGRFMAEALLWNFWPKLVSPEGGHAAMRFSVTCDGRPVPVPSPDEVPPLTAFADALRAVRACESGRKTPADFPTFHIFEVRSHRPKTSLGWLALHTVAAKRRPAEAEDPASDADQLSAAGFTGPAHHVALMRTPELVVQYRPGPDLNNPDIEWAGVFKAADSVDAAFAAAEPPTHDDWRPNLVKDDRHRSLVNVGLRRIKEHVTEALTNRVRSTDPGVKMSGVVIADALGHLIMAGPGTGASPTSRRSRSSSRARRSTPRATITRQWFEEDAAGSILLNLEFEVAHASGAAATIVEVSAGAAAGDGSRENDPPLGASVPEILALHHAGRTIPGNRVRIAADEDASVVVTIRQPPGVAAALGIDAISEDSA